MKQVGKRRGFICCLAQYGVELNSEIGLILLKDIKEALIKMDYIASNNPKWVPLFPSVL